MKRRDVIRRITERARETGNVWSLARKGANHDVYRLGGLMIPVPRHNELGEALTEKIFKECEPVLGERWWK